MILFENQYSSFSGDYDHNLADQICTVKVPPVFLGRGWRKKIEGRDIHLLEPDGKFPAGLTERVAAALGQEIVDQRILPTWGTPWKATYSLHPFQQTAVECLLTPPHRGVCWAPTSSGKTYIAAEVIRRIALPALYLVHRAEIVDQVHKKFTSWFPEKKIGICYAEVVDPSPEITVASVFSAHKLDLSAYPVLVCDEAHHCPMDTYQNVLLGSAAPFRFGFSGTPFGRSDNKDLMLISATGEVRFKMSQQELQTLGLAPRVGVIYFDFIHSEGASLLFEKKPWNRVETGLIVNNKERNLLIVDICKSSVGKVLVFVNRISHGAALTSRLKDLGEDVIFCHGSNSKSDRIQALADSHRITIATKIFEEGIDIPDFETIVLAAGDKAAIALMQRIGRGLRFQEGKVLKIIDINDIGHRMLERHVKAREKVFRYLGYEIYAA